MKSEPKHLGARLGPQDQPQPPRNCNGFCAWRSSRLDHALRLVLRTQPRAVAEAARP